MDAGRKPYRTGLVMKKYFLPVLLFLHITGVIYAEDFEMMSSTESIVFVEIAPVVITAGNPWTLTITVDYPVAEDVSIIAPRFADSLVLSRLLKLPRVMETKVQTVFEYSFISNKSGQFTLESFTVVTPEGITETKPLVLNILDTNAAAMPVTPRVVWENVPAQMEVGESAVLTLRARDWSSFQPPPEFFMPDVPQGVIFSSVYVSQTERAGGVMSKFNVIPLEGDFRLNARVLAFENYIFEIPALSIRVINREGDFSAKLPEDSSGTFDVEITAQPVINLEDELLNPSRLADLEKARQLKLITAFLLFFIVLVVVAFLLWLLLKSRYFR